MRPETAKANTPDTQRLLWRGLAVLVLLSAASFSATGDPPQGQAQEEAPAARRTGTQHGPAETEEGPAAGTSDAPAWEKDRRRRYILLGLLNLYPELAEMTASIDRDINRRFSLLLPRWREPETFADWRDRGMLVNALIGYGEDINEYTGWFVVAAWGAGPIKNSESYMPLGIPIEIGVNFYRSTLVLEAGLDLFPWGRPAQRSFSSLSERIRESRPFFTALAGMNWQREEADVNVRMPLLGRVLHIEKVENHTLFYSSVSTGIEMPLSERTSVIAAAGYNFFFEDPAEYNGPLFITTLRWRF